MEYKLSAQGLQNKWTRAIVSKQLDLNPRNHISFAILSIHFLRATDTLLKILPNGLESVILAVCSHLKISELKRFCV